MIPPETLEAPTPVARISDDEARLYGSATKAQLHELAEDLHATGLKSNEELADSDHLCLVPIPVVTPEEIRALRAEEDVSQAVLARHLGVSPNTVRRWEAGEESPPGPVVVLLGIVRRHGLHSLV